MILLQGFQETQNILFQGHKLREAHNKRFCYEGTSFRRLKRENFVSRFQASGDSKQNTLSQGHKLREAHNKSFCYKGTSFGRLITKVFITRAQAFGELIIKDFVTRAQASGGSSLKLLLRGHKLRKAHNKSFCYEGRYFFMIL